jgi:hypothetical protein
VRPALALFLVAYVANVAARWLSAGRAPAARDHARWIVGVVPVVLLLLHHRSRYRRPQHRDRHLGIAIPIFALFPLRPRPGGVRPHQHRQQPRPGSADRPLDALLEPVRRGADPARGLRPRRRHAAAAALRAPLAKALAVVGPLVTLSVLATGHDYVFDVAAGLLATAAGFAAGRLPIGFHHPRRRSRPVRPRPRNQGATHEQRHHAFPRRAGDRSRPTERGSPRFVAFRAGSVNQSSPALVGHLAPVAAPVLGHRRARGQPASRAPPAF